MDKTKPQAPKTRLASVDALRGITVAAMLLVNDPGDWGHVFAPLGHARWNGATPTDFIFPMFLFVMGVSVALAIVPRLERGQSHARLRNAALWRALRIVALGVLINALAAWLMPGREMRWPGVLQRIGVCFAVVGMFAIHTPRRAWWMAVVALLAVYAAILHAGGTLDKWINIDDRLDTFVFGHAVWNFNHATGQGHDPEGLLSTLGALASSLLGLCAGMWLRARRMRHLLIAGLVALALGAVWSWWLPFNKNLWTPSFVLWTAGWSMLVLAAFHWMMDMRGWPPLGRRFGVNAIAAYAGSEIMQVLLPATGLQALLYAPLSRWITPVAGPYVASLTFALLFVLLWWVIVWVMDKRHWYLKI
ncbi:MAG TPA: heparan-alpha-glucosaminide N-acetyltransferase domain-containing protein [Rhodanobacteraceae bacterium]|nr:heparan-alpha-glucosaminide N-acetyltransferase domain-containing protein [Rhodanobacteraceae bacterium]